MKKVSRKTKILEWLFLYGGLALILGATPIEFKIIGAVLVIIYWFTPTD